MPSVSELEFELEKLRESTKLALEATWADLERLQKENATKDDQIHCLLKDNHTKDVQIAKLRIEISAFRQHDYNEKEETEVASSEDVSAAENSLIRSASRRFSRRNSPPTEPSLTRSRGSINANVGTFIRKCSSYLADSNDQRQEIENDFMNQLSVMQQDKKIAIDEMNIKLKQRETAIDTLEKIIALREDTVSSLRDENERLKKDMLENERGCVPQIKVKKNTSEIKRLSLVVAPNTRQESHKRKNSMKSASQIEKSLSLSNFYPTKRLNEATRAA